MNARFKENQLSLEHSVDFDKEEMLNTIIETSGMSQELFEIFFVIEEFPVEITRIDDQFRNETTIRVHQEFKLRRRHDSDAELQLALEEHRVNSSNASSIA